MIDMKKKVGSCDGIYYDPRRILGYFSFTRRSSLGRTERGGLWLALALGLPDSRRSASEENPPAWVVRWIGRFRLTFFLSFSFSLFSFSFSFGDG